MWTVLNKTCDHYSTFKHRVSLTSVPQLFLIISSVKLVLFGRKYQSQGIPNKFPLSIFFSFFFKIIQTIFAFQISSHIDGEIFQLWMGFKRFRLDDTIVIS